MSPFYVTRCWNKELGRREYTVCVRHWFTLAKYLISIGAVSTSATERYENAGYTLERLPMDERIKKSKRCAIMNDCFNWFYGSGTWSKSWSDWLNEGIIYPRDGFQKYRTNENYLRIWKTFSRAIGNRGYFLTDDGMRKYLNVLPKLSVYREEAEKRKNAKILAVKKRLEQKKLEEIKKDF